MLIKKVACLLLIVIMMISLPAGGAAADTVWSGSVSVAFSGGTRKVTAVYADMTDKTLRLEVVPANNRIGTTAPLSAIAQSETTGTTSALAAINGTFFTAYTDNQPVGALISKGDILNISDYQSTVGFGGLNEVVFGSMKITVTGAVNGDWSWDKGWYAWGFNHVFEDGIGSIEIFTPAYGTTTGTHSKTSIVVREGAVTSVVRGQAPIYGDGYTIVCDVASIAAHFSPGDKVEYQAAFSGTAYNGLNDEAADWSQVRSAISCGPTIVKNGVVTADAVSEGFTESKITTGAAQRSFIGYTADSILIMATVPNVTVKQLGEIALKMGCLNAINLDGGASSGLWYGGSYLTKPGRNLSNAIVVTRLPEVPINILLNGRYVYYDVDPYIQNGRTMLPFRGIMEDLGAAVTWDGTAQRITAVRGDTTLVMTLGSKVVFKNGIPVTLDAAVELKEGRTCVPVRFMAELLGGSVDYIDTARIADIDIP